MPARLLPGQTPARPAFRAGVGLTQLISRQTPIVWFEAVAIAQELYAVLQERAPAETLIGLEAADVAITPSGGIELRRDVAPGQPPVPQAARVLLTLLEEVQTLPVQLRLLALQEVSPSPSCRTILELSTRLALFERPGRQAAIRDVYERFSRLPPREAESRAAPPPPAALTGRGSVPWWWRREVQTLAAALALAAVTAVTAVWWWPPVAAAGASVSDAAAKSASTVAGWFGGKTAPQPIASPPARTMNVRSAPPTTPARRPRPRPEARPTAPPAPVQPAAAAPVAPDTAVYTAADTDVTPPVPVRSRLQVGPGSEVRTEEIPEVELVVSPAGDVESVRLMTSQVGVRPAMMLSAIKTWRFDPATKDGRPVRYKLRMRLTNQ